MTKKEALKSIKNLPNSDYIYGIKDAISGIYDKFYRYNRKDDGYEYDKGIKWALNNILDIEIVTILEYNN